MKKILLLIVFVFSLILFISCDGKNSEKSFVDLIDENSSYKAVGLMESFYPNGRKQNEFEVLYKSKDNLKVTLKHVDSDEEQIILKNNEGTYVLIPSVNKNFKIQSSWPDNASYPYLLNSLVKDIKSIENCVITENDNSVTYETQTFMFKDASGNKEKIIVDKNTNLPTEVIIYDSNGEIFVRVVFRSIDLNYNFNSDDFNVEKTMSIACGKIEENKEFENRSIEYPVSYPEGMKLVDESIVSSTDGKEVVGIMKYSDNEKTFTLIEEFINPQNNTTFQQEYGEAIMILGVLAIEKENSIIMVNNGVEYTIASDSVSISVMREVLESFLTTEEK